MAAKQSNEKKVIRVKDPDKYEYAYLLCMQKVPQKNIANRVGVGQQAVVKWKDSGSWGLKRFPKTVSHDRMDDVADILTKFGDWIIEQSGSDKTITTKFVQIFTKCQDKYLLKCINNG